ncbi:hypothetical protein OJ997_31145 [Solirubrobacter phytolaccae]|uniref:Uncharacterized protein n=1 Tax=Solirubrobacter phytolaccae TaxID=1404360 RepID=A0A9X3NH19_9ACTN|nr:hypothetical protein [Solirubrobacter phytolaccae]MDA0184800.1 hypothetical protein [Solirubrobacter phytolaccae]
MDNHRSRRRPTPAIIVAFLALFVALTGTAAAAVIIDSPDDLGDRVVTQRAMAAGSVSGSQLTDRAVHGVHMVHPVIRARVLKNGDVPLLGFEELDTRRLGPGLYQVDFSGFDLDGRTLKNCAITANPRINVPTNTPTFAMVSSGDSLTATIAVYQVLPTGGAKLADNEFDVVASC